MINLSFGGKISSSRNSMDDYTTAYEAYYKAIEDFNLPASVPVIDNEGRVGLATQAIDFLNNEQAFSLLFSDDKMDRAKAAIYACEHTLKKINDDYSDLNTPQL
jgi:hypothetical protein